MADSVGKCSNLCIFLLMPDRVFVHALNTVKRIPRLGSARPPPSERLKLYGLYKQSMEGNVEGVMDRPTGRGDDVRSEQSKWDAWRAHGGISRTEAKRQYISTLIDTMHRYASQTPDARELVGELEFVWAQIKDNSPSESSQSQSAYPSYSGQDAQDSPEGSSGQGAYARMSKADEADVEDDEREDFVDARDSQIGVGEYEDEDDEHESQQQVSPPDGGHVREKSAAEAILGPIARYLNMQAVAAAAGVSAGGAPAARDDPGPSAATLKWQRRVEAALVKMNAEMAALREQLEMSGLPPAKRRPNRLGWLGWLGAAWDLGVRAAWAAARHVAVDLALLALVAVYVQRHNRRVGRDGSGGGGGPEPLTVEGAVGNLWRALQRLVAGIARPGAGAAGPRARKYLAPSPSASTAAGRRLAASLATVPGSLGARPRARAAP